MMSSVIPARLLFQCGHAALVSLPRIKGETSPQRADRVAREKSAAHTRACDFCAQRLEVVVQQAPPAPVIAAQMVAAPALAAPVVAAVPTPLPSVPQPLPLPAVPPVAAEPLKLVPPVPALIRPAPDRSRKVAERPLERQPKPKRAAVAKTPTAVVPTAARRFVVRVRLQTVLEAIDVRDALRQAQALGAIEVLEISRQR